LTKERTRALPGVPGPTRSDEDASLLDYLGKREPSSGAQHRGCRAALETTADRLRP
jgi:hypothetical protein